MAFSVTQPISGVLRHVGFGQGFSGDSDKYARSNDPKIAIEYRDRLLAAEPQPTIWRYLLQSKELRN